MGSVRRRAKRLESAISICLMAVLFLIGVGVFLRQFDAGLSRFGIDTTTNQLPIANRKSQIANQLSSLVPAGFEILSEIEVYNTENLYEKINGKAPLYTDAGFERLFTRRFVSKDDESLWLELFVYDMAATRGAFSVYSVQKRAGVEILPAFAFAYRTGNAMYFVHGKYYIELVGSAESAELFKAMVEIAENVRAGLTVDGDTRIAEPALFPQEDLVPGSVKLYLTNAFGFEKLTDTFTSQYQIAGKAVTAFLSKRTGSKDAAALAESYHKFLIENGAVVKNTTNETLQGRIVDFYGTVEIVFAIGPFVAGIHEAQNQQSAEELAVMLINKLSEAAKAKSND